MANSSITLTGLDFGEMKNSLKSYLKSQDQFKDYDFEGSNMSVLLDILSFNTYHNAYYLNMTASEMFLDSAKLRDSVVSHAKELNYVPKSFTSSEASVNIKVVSSDVNKTSLTIPKGTQFSSRIGSNTYTFSTNENLVVSGSGTFWANGVSIYEGTFITETFNIDYSSEDKIVLQNETVDVNSLSVVVIEDGGATTHEYLRAISLFGHTPASEIFFIQGARGSKYEIIFGDGVIGRKPKDNSTVVVEYRISNGELPNDCQIFSPVGLLDGESNITITTTQPAHSGTVSESIESIKYNAPRHFTTQERAVTSEDYENLLKLNFAEINAVAAYGGEERSPPQFGKVFVSVDLKNIDGLPQSKKDQYYNFIKPRSPVSIDPVFIDPEYMYIYITSTVKYNINKTSLTPNDIKMIVTSAIVDFAEQNLNSFNKTLRFSKLTNAIDNSNQAIISNESSINVVREINLVKTKNQSVDINFGFALEKGITSSIFIFDGVESRFADEDGSIQIRNNNTILDVGTINYETGLIQLSPFESYANLDKIRLYAVPKSNDVFSNKNTIINILASDINIQVQQVRE